MIYTTLTKKCFGIELFGDYNDLDRLYKVIHHCADGYAENSGAKDHLHYFAYEVRHAMQGTRERKTIKQSESDSSTYYSTSFALPYYVLFINLMQNSIAQERRLWQTSVIWELTADLQETSLNSGSLEFLRSVEYWAFNTLLNQPRLITGESLLSAATRDVDTLTILADYAVFKFQAARPENRLAEFGRIMNFIHPYTDDHKAAIRELQSRGVSLENGGHLEFDLLDIKLW